MKLLNQAIWLVVLISLLGCNAEPITVQIPIYSIYKPILMDEALVTTEVKLLAVQPNKTIIQLKPINDYMLALDYGIGLHIIDVKDVNNPHKIGFYQIPACIDFEVKGNLVYANNYKDFIVIDFSDINNPIITIRLKDEINIEIKPLDELEVQKELQNLPPHTTIISYEKYEN